MGSVKKTVCISGLGYIGLPTACVLANSNYAVLGVDINKNVITKIQSAKIVNLEPGLQDLLIRVIQNGSLTLSIKPNYADVHIITVPTPLDRKNRPDISYVNAAMVAIQPYLRKGSLVLIESTCPVGTTKELAYKLRNNCPNVHVAYCPERVLSGNIIYELIYNDRIVGGIDSVSTSRAAEFYRSFVRGEVLTTNAQTAELVKLAENTYRDVNIAYANELSILADYMDIDVYNLIKLANKHPRVQILNPGTGVGGHCIAIDPQFLISAAPNLTNFISKAREVNVQKTNWVIQRIKNVIKRTNASIVACLGLTYKPNTSDTRESSALTIIQELKKEIEVLCVDPYVPETIDPYEAISRANIVIGLVAHDLFLSIPKDLLVNKIILDFARVFK